MNKENPYRLFLYLLALLLILIVSYQTFYLFSGQNDTLFQSVPSSHSNLTFSNDLTFTDSFHIYRDSYFLAGGGVALGDFNNNGLLDIYLVSNQESNRLYLNKGDFRFEDITQSAGVAGSKPWSTGVSLADLNGNGFLDIYVTNSGSSDGEKRMNELFINNGDLTFTERAVEFGVADSGYSIHAAFFDLDNSGYLDLYVMNNHAYQSHNTYDLENLDRNKIDFNSGDRLYKNSGNIFTDITEEAGIFSSEASFGFGISIADLTRNGFMDIYISNDFFERDYLYLNNGDGTFREALEQYMHSTSTTSMGGDIADLDNDGFPEIFITDMLPETEERIKRITDFINWEQFREEVDLGYHRKFTRNTLHYNHGDGRFSEIGRYAGVDASDWSWGALMADFNLDGLRDIFVPNGFYRDITDKDYLLESFRPEFLQSLIVNGEIDYEQLIERIPSTPVPNAMFENLGDLRFSNRSREWGLDQPGFSHGAAYGDLNGNGALDLVVNNVNMEASVYRNRTPDLHPERSWLQINLKGEPPNTFGVGAQIDVISGDRYWYAEQMLQRGFMSSMDPLIHLGLGEGVQTVDTLRVRWPDGRWSILTNLGTNSRVEVRQEASASEPEEIIRPGAERRDGTAPLLRELTDRAGLEWSHAESEFNDFERFPLLFHMVSTEGPPICAGDLQGNGRDDIYIGGARGQPGVLFLQGSGGDFVSREEPLFEADAASEDTDCLFIDTDQNGREELYVASGSSEFAAGNSALADRLYRMGPNGELVRDPEALPRPAEGHLPTGVVRMADFDGDGFPDLFVGARLTPRNFELSSGYGIPVGGRLLLNDGSGRFRDVTGELAPGLQAGQLETAGITAAEWGDLNGNGRPDLVVAGDWMPLTLFYNRNGRLEPADNSSGLASTRGWWKSLALADLNGNGRLDLIGGNHGLNSRFRATLEEPLQMWVGDFDRNGRIDHLFARYSDGEGPYPVALWQNMVQQLPYLGTRISSFSEYAGMTIPELFSAEQLENAFHYRAELFESIIAWNDGDSFRIDPLPSRAQWSPLYSILPMDLVGDGKPELLLGGNLDAVQPQAGRYDAGYGTVLRQDEHGKYRYLPGTDSGFIIEGEIRSIRMAERKDRPLILVGRNNDQLQMFEIARQGD